MALKGLMYFYHTTLHIFHIPTQGAITGLLVAVAISFTGSMGSILYGDKPTPVPPIGHNCSTLWPETIVNVASNGTIINSTYYNVIFMESDTDFQNYVTVSTLSESVPMEEEKTM